MRTRVHPRHRTRQRVPSMAAIAAAVAVVCMAATPASPADAAPAVPTGPGTTALASPGGGPGLSIGSWNINLTPFLGGQSSIVDEVASSDFDVLALQGVWSRDAEDALLADPRIQDTYPYHYAAPALQQAGSIPFTPAFTRSATRTIRPTPQVTDDALHDYVSCLIETGTDTRTVLTPAAPIDGFCQFLGLNIALESQPGFATLVSTLQVVPEGDPGAYQAIDRGFNGTGVQYGYAGRSGQLVLSRFPISDPVATHYDTYLIHRQSIEATIAGLRFAFADWPPNYLDEIDPSLGPLQTGALQPDVAQDVVDHRVDLVVGTVSSGPDYQSDAYDLLGDAGYVPSTTADTYCPDGEAGFSRCAEQPAKAVDNIFALPDVRCIDPGTFATDQLSEHIGVSASCGQRPDVSAVAPARGPAGGGQDVVITGSGFTGATRVLFGAGTPATSYVVDSDTQITAVAPSHQAGTVVVRVKSVGLSAKTSVARYRFARGASPE